MEEACELSPPRQVPAYIADHAIDCLEAKVDPCRPAQILRRFVQSSEPLENCSALSACLSWDPAPALKRDYETGEVWDTGRKLLREKAVSSLQTGVPAVDAAITQIVDIFGIDDPGAYLLCNKYKDGRSFIAPHQHDFWSATFSFGASRIFLLDKQPILLEDGDVLVFGSQRHSVPKQLDPRQSGERVSLSLFWYPAWRVQTRFSGIADSGDGRAELAAWRRANGDMRAEWAAKRASAVDSLREITGCDLASVVCALNSTNDDLDEALTLLLAKRPSTQRSAVTNSGRSPEADPLKPSRSRWRKKA